MGGGLMFWDSKIIGFFKVNEGLYQDKCGELLQVLGQDFFFFFFENNWSQ